MIKIIKDKSLLININIIWVIIFILLILNMYIFNNIYLILDSSIYFEDYIVERCEVHLLVNSINLYEDIELVILYNEKSYDNLNISSSILEFFTDWKFLDNPERGSIFIKGNWLDVEMVNCFFDYKGKRLFFRLLLIYQDNEKFNLHTKDNVFPVLLNLDSVEFILNYPFRKWYCGFSNSVQDLEKLIESYNDLGSRSVKKPVFILSKNKTCGEILFMKEDYLQDDFYYKKLFTNDKK